MRRVSIQSERIGGRTEPNHSRNLGVGMFGTMAWDGTTTLQASA